LIDWLWERTADWQWDVFWPELLGKAAGVLVGIVLSWYLLIRRRLQSMNRLLSGDSDDVLFQAHYLHRISPTEVGTGADVGDAASQDGLDRDNAFASRRSPSFQLLFRNVAEKKTVPQIYDNPAAAQLVKKLGDQTNLNQPILPTQGTIGFEVLNDAANWMSGVAAGSSNEREVWLFCLTAEDRQVVRKRCVRCFLIRPEDLKRFHDWDWCREQITIERPWHWFRVVALHRVARLYADQCRMYAAADQASAMPLVDDQSGHRRIVPLSLGLIQREKPVCRPVFVDWETHLRTVIGSQLTLEAAPWPAEQLAVSS